LMEFGSVVDAVLFAVEFQCAMQMRNAEVPEDSCITYRIGINIGDIIVEGDDIYGDGVNIASRIEGLAEPGGICIARNAYNQVKGKVDLNFEHLGEKEVKNIAEPVSVYRVLIDEAAAALITPVTARADRSRRVWSLAVAAAVVLVVAMGGALWWQPWAPDVEPASAERMALPLPDKPSIAVLSFDNMSDDSSQEYFADGIAEDIITDLSKISGLFVIARNSSFSYKGQQIRVQKIAEELGARYILEGSVRKAGQRLRITAQLIDAQSGHHVWAERFDRQMEDIFDVQDEITNHIAATIMPELEHFENRRSATKRTEDLNAWDYYLRGMQTFHSETCEGTTASIGMLKAAVDLDPSYCDAWARLGWCHARLVMFKCVEDHEAALKLAFEATRKAIALDDGSAVAHLCLGTTYIWAGETALGLAEAQIALQLNPNFAYAGMAVGNRLDLMGQTEEGIAQMERALTLNPRDPLRWRYMGCLSRAYIRLDQYETAADWARQAVLLRPDLPEALVRCAVSVAHLDAVALAVPVTTDPPPRIREIAVDQAAVVTQVTRRPRYTVLFEVAARSANDCP
ncbi:MAG: adenylate/guanylate cyclase domain-containing protein, partial [Proteobacteria bacterium]|nr:adenylate/guanylate cyclase domain-containing protein [Pseudomonadota bacterium]